LNVVIGYLVGYL